MKKMQFLICILLVISIVFTFAILNYYSTNRLNPLMNKQWYLLNNGDKKAIISSNDYRDYLEMKSGFDISAIGMWEIVSSYEFNQDVIVAVIDTGIDYLHEDLQESLWINTGEIPAEIYGMEDAYWSYDFDQYESTESWSLERHYKYTGACYSQKDQKGTEFPHVFYEYNYFS